MFSYVEHDKFYNPRDRSAWVSAQSDPALAVHMKNLEPLATLKVNSED